MDEKIESLRIETLETRIGLRRFVCAALDMQLEQATTDSKRRELSRQRDEAWNGYYVLCLALEMVKKKRDSVPRGLSPAI